MTQKEAASDIAKSIFLLAAFLFWIHYVLIQRLSQEKTKKMYFVQRNVGQNA